MKIKNKGKVYPSPSSSSPSSSSSSVATNGGDEKEKDFLSVLSLLPAAILALASILSLADREVLAYMITRSLKTTTSTTPTSKNPSSLIQESKKKSSKKLPTSKTNNGTVNGNHKAPVFDCDCFDCYTSYWFRWDSSPNRELIHQVIEAFEDHLTNGEQSKKTTTTRGKRRDRLGKKPALDVLLQPEMMVPVLEASTVEKGIISEPSSSSVPVSPDDDVSPAAASPEKAADGVEEEEVVEREGVKGDGKVTAAAETAVVVEVALSNHKGLARKVLPDVLGLLNSRLWSLWGPSV